MKKSYRIRKNEEFSKIIAKKHFLSNASFVLYFDRKKEDNSRIGISVSKKLGDAVTRNKIKRQVRMMFVNFYDFENSECDLICIVRSKFLQNSFNDNQNDLEKIVKKAIINGENKGV